MNLHLTVNGKWIDSVSIDPFHRRNQEYIENKKLLLKFRHKQLFEDSKLAGEFYLDPLSEEELSLLLNEVNDPSRITNEANTDAIG